jgi:chemotaxis protein CheD
MSPASTVATTRVGVAALEILQSERGVIITHALGSCIGITVFDRNAGVGGLLHYMLPKPVAESTESTKPPAMFATRGIPLLFRTAYDFGAKKNSLVVCAAGAAGFLNDEAGFQIGKRNRTMMRKLFWKNNIVLAAEDTGGSEARTMSLDLSTGTVTIRSKNQERVLWSP